MGFPLQSLLMPLLDAELDDVLVVVGVALDGVELELLLNGIDMFM